jgi:hypothetical protein
MGIPGHSQQLIQRRLTRPMVADGQLTDAEYQIDVDDVAAHASGQGHRRHVVAAGVAPGAETLLDERAGGGHQVRRGAHRVIGPQQPDHGGHSPRRNPAELQRWDPRMHPGFATSARKMDVAVHQPGNDSAALEIALHHAQAPRQFRIFMANPENPFATNQQV